MNVEQLKNIENLIQLGPDKKIKSHKLKRLTAPGENYGSLMLSVEISVETPTGNEEVHAIAKMVPPNEFIQEVFNTQVTFRNEIALYKKIVPLLRDFQKEHGVEELVDFAAKYYGSRINLQDDENGLFRTVESVIEKYQPIGKAWVGTQLYIFTTEPKHVETILTNSLNRSQIYTVFNFFVKDSLLSSNANLWKKNRKMMNPSFNKKITDSFHEIFVKYTTEFVEVLNKSNGREKKDVLNQIWKSSLDMAIDSLTDLNPDLIKNKEMSLQAVMKLEEFFVQGFQSLFILSSLKSLLAARKGREFAEQILLLSRESNLDSDDPLKNKLFLPRLMKICEEQNGISSGQILEETLFMLVAASETVSIASTFVLTILGVDSEVQKKVYEEVMSTIGSLEKDPTLEDTNKMSYLERVIKETMRLFPVGPFVGRRADKNFQLDSYTIPEGSQLLIPITLLHKDPKVWPNPEKFDPDRFLPQEVEKRHRCSYIPFSYGSRNCIGRDYAMRMIKVLISMIVQRFRIKSTTYKSIEDIEVSYSLIIKPGKSSLVFEKRTG